MNFILINEDKVIWWALVGSLLIHGLLFVFSGRTFIQHAQYGVQPSAQMVEVSIKEIKDPETFTTLDVEKAADSTKRISKAKEAVRSKSGVRVKANPDYFQNSAPEYPELAKQMHQEGIVMLLVDVNKEGDPMDMRIIQSSGFRMLDQAALKAVGHWKFQPGSIGNVHIESTVTVPIRFRLE